MFLVVLFSTKKVFGPLFVLPDLKAELTEEFCQSAKNTRVTESYLHDTYWFSGVNSRSASSDGNGLSNSISKLASLATPATPRSEDEILQSSNLKSFSLADLKTATRNFRPDSVLGEGGFGAVFKGWIDEQSFLAAKPGTGLVIAVKRLNQESFQGHKEWLVSF